jgi:hypothetical protein
MATTRTERTERTTSKQRRDPVAVDSPTHRVHLPLQNAIRHPGLREWVLDS